MTYKRGEELVLTEPHTYEGRRVEQGFREGDCVVVLEPGVDIGESRDNNDKRTIVKAIDGPHTGRVCWIDNTCLTPVVTAEEVQAAITSISEAVSAKAHEVAESLPGEQLVYMGLVVPKFTDDEGTFGVYATFDRAAVAAVKSATQDGLTIPAFIGVEPQPPEPGQAEAAAQIGGRLTWALETADAYWRIFEMEVL